MRQLPVADPGTPDTRSPARFLLWVGRQQLGTLLLGMTFGVSWMLAQALLPWERGRTVDE
ncbi:MAG: ABC transporter ATP-binding protein, partial [Thermoleophilia bacterium]|nr:ABC transporter ATP-binding protein [Thermoleophilia bacterium]